MLYRYSRCHEQPLLSPCYCQIIEATSAPTLYHHLYWKRRFESAAFAHEVGGQSVANGFETDRIGRFSAEPTARIQAATIKVGGFGEMSHPSSDAMKRTTRVQIRVIVTIIVGVVGCGSSGVRLSDAGGTDTGRDVFPGDALDGGYVDQGPAGRGGAGGAGGMTGAGGVAGAGDGSAGAGAAGNSGAGGVPGCGTLANTASPVTPTSLAATRRDYAGGPLADGVYDLMAVEQTDPIVAGEQYRRTISIETGATAFQWAIDDVNVVGSGSFDLAGGLALSGAVVSFSGSCAPGGGYFYTANGTQFALYFIPPNMSEKIYHFQLHQ